MAERIRPSSSRFPGLIISDLVFTDVKLGRGADATVYEVDWNETVCAAKRLHDALLEDESPGGVEKLISSFEAECLTWSKLRHPYVVQFLGVYLEGKSRLPVLVMEKMDTSLRRYLEGHSKEEFPLHQKMFVLRQVAQALAYLHSQNPPLVHHDLSPNNVLLNMGSFVTKVSDFGMSRAINPSALSRKSSIKGTQAFMPPEALHDPPRYNETLDVFSFGNVIISALTHEWPNPGPPNQCQGDQIIGVSELQRRERYIAAFTVQEKQLFLPIVNRCLENRPNKRPSSVVLVREIRRIESALPVDGHVAAPIEHLHQQLSAKEEECRLKDEALREKDEVIREKDEVIREKDEVVREKDEVIREKDEALREKEAELQRLRKEAGNEQKEGVKTSLELRQQLAVAQVMHPVRDWRKLGKCQKVIQHRPGGGGYGGVAVNSEGLLAVSDNVNTHLLTKEGALVRSIGEGVLGGSILFGGGVAFDTKGNVWVTDMRRNKVFKLSQDGQLLRTVHHTGRESDRLKDPIGVFASQGGQIYICDQGNHRVTVHGEEGEFQFMFGSFGSDPGCFGAPHDITFGSDGLVYVTDVENKRVCVWSKKGTFKRDFKTKYYPTWIAATADNHLLITSYLSHTVMVYTLDGQLIHEFGGSGPDPGKFKGPRGICVDKDGLVYVADFGNRRVQVF